MLLLRRWTKLIFTIGEQTERLKNNADEKPEFRIFPVSKWANGGAESVNFEFWSHENEN